MANLSGSIRSPLKQLGLNRKDPTSREWNSVRTQPENPKHSKHSLQNDEVTVVMSNCQHISTCFNFTCQVTTWCTSFCHSAKTSVTVVKCFTALTSTATRRLLLRRCPFLYWCLPIPPFSSVSIAATFEDIDTHNWHDATFRGVFHDEQKSRTDVESHRPNENPPPLLEVCKSHSWEQQVVLQGSWLADPWWRYHAVLGWTALTAPLPPKDSRRAKPRQSPLSKRHTSPRPNPNATPRSIPKAEIRGHYVWVVTISVDLNKAGKLLHVRSPAWGRRISRKAGQRENPRKLPWPDKKGEFAILEQTSAVNFLSGPNQWDTEVILLYQVHIHP